jgi:CRP-like cAMP-binding protein
MKELRGEASPLPSPSWPELRSGSSQDYPRGCRLFRQGDEVQWLYLIETGFVKLVHTTRTGRDFIVGFSRAPSILGSIMAVVARTHMVTAEALTDCEVRPISIGDFHALLRSSATFSMRLHRQHAQEVQDQTALAVGLAMAPRYRLESLLLTFIRDGHVARWRAGLRLEPQFRRRELAELIHVCPEQMSRLLSTLEREGVIAREKQWLVIPLSSPLLQDVSLPPGCRS